MAPSETVQLSVTVPKTVADRLEAIADERMVGKGVVVGKALDAFFKTLPPMPGEEPTPRGPSHRAAVGPEPAQ